MFLPQILLLSLLALLARLTAGGEARRWLVLAGSGLCVYWLQPATPVRSLDFWLPTATLALTMLGWLLTAAPDAGGPENRRLYFSRRNLAAAGVLVGTALLAGLTRYLGPGDWLTASRPPVTGQVLVGLAAVSALLGGLALARQGWGGRRPGAWNGVLWAGVIGLIVLLVWLKTPALALEAGRGLRALVGQNPSLATAVDVRWLGFSYTAFRLIHTLRDRQAGRLPAADLRTYASYVLFFPAFVAGPIDRLERFAKDFNREEAERAGSRSKEDPKGFARESRQLQTDETGQTGASSGDKPLGSFPDGESRALQADGGGPTGAAVGGKLFGAALGIAARPWGGTPARLADPVLEGDLSAAAVRIVVGLFKKFAVADTLALAALSPANALQVTAPGWLWVLVYLYALQIFFDFSGYTDVAIGMGRLLGVKLPENFAAPYFKPNLTQFWNAWHMSLTQWFRAYFFNPLVRALRGRKLNAAAVLLITQTATMLLIGLWHGVTVSFALWGLWHGLGLFLQNRWTDKVSRPWLAAHPPGPLAARVLTVVSTLVTFHFVALGWVLFALPADTAATVLARLFGGGW